MNLNLNPVNTLPIPTWRWLKLNNSQIKIDELGEYKSVEPTIKGSDQEGLLLNSVKNADFPEIATGMGSVTKEFAEGHAGQVVNLRIAKGAVVPEPVIFNYQLADNIFTVNDNYIYAEDNSKCKIIFVYSSPFDTKGFHGSSIKVFAGENAVVEIIQLQVLGANYNNFTDVGAAVDSKGKIVVKQFDLGAANNWLGIEVDASKTKSKIRLKNLYLAGKNQKIDINYLVKVLGPKNDIKINSKGLLLDKAQKTFRGTLDFQRGCKGSVGTEAEDVVLMDEDVVNKSIPVILCGEDDIQGDHAASIGEMDEQQVFYLKTRGLNDSQIRRMVIDSKVSIMENDLPEELHYLLDDYKEVAYPND